LDFLKNFQVDLLNGISTKRAKIYHYLTNSQKGVKSFSGGLTMVLTRLFGYCKIWQNEIDNYGQLFPEDI